MSSLHPIGEKGRFETRKEKISSNISVSGQLLCSCGKPCKIPLCKECFEKEMKRQQKEQSNLR